MPLNLHTSTKIEKLALQLAENVLVSKSIFNAPTIFIPNFNMKKWLQLELARINRISAHLKFQYLEQGLWDLLKGISPSTSSEFELLTRDKLQLLILRVFLNSEFEEADLKIFENYLQTENQTIHSQKAWQLSQKLAQYFQEYLFQRMEMVYQWEQDQLYLKKESKNIQTMEKAQKTLYQKVFGEVMSKTGIQFKSLSQLWEVVKVNLNVPKTKKPSIHIFSLSHLSPFHIEVMKFLGKFYELNLYQLDFSFSLQGKLKAEQNQLLKLWGKPGRELFESLENVPERKICELENSTGKSSASLLKSIQESILKPLGKTILKQDKSLQIFSSPSLYREVETVFNSILFNLKEDPNLQQTDIAVLTTNMKKYRAPIESVFSRDPQLLLWNLSDSSAATDSLFAEGVLALLELADGPFTRKKVFSLLTNPCIQEKFNFDQRDINVWLNWAEKLGVFRWYNSTEKSKEVHPGEDEKVSFYYTWDQALKRLRLGRIMEGSGNGGMENYQDLIPFSDLESSNLQLLGKFSEIIDTLYQNLKPLSRLKTDCKSWNIHLKEMFSNLLEIPQDHHGELSVKKSLYQKMEDFFILDQPLNDKNKIGLETYKELIQTNLESIDSRKGSYLIDGISVSTLSPMRPIPFKMIYVLGLGEGEFPARQESTILNLSNIESLKGDISPTEGDCYKFLETLFSAKEKLYLSYVSKNLQKDQDLYPSSVINQLKNYIESFTDKDFQIIPIPLNGKSPKYFNPPYELDTFTDLFWNYSFQDLLLFFMDLVEQGNFQDIQPEQLEKIETFLGRITTSPKEDNQIQISESQVVKLEMVLSRLLGKIEEFQTIPLESDRDQFLANFLDSKTLVQDLKTSGDPEVIRLKDLKKFLENPFESILERQTKIERDLDDDLIEVEDEPFLTPFPNSFNLRYNPLVDFVVNYGKGGDENDFKNQLLFYYDSQKRMSKVPEGVFGDFDFKRYSKDMLLQRDILEDFLSQRKGDSTFLGIFSIGENLGDDFQFRKFPETYLSSQNVLHIGQAILISFAF